MRVPDRDGHADLLDCQLAESVAHEDVVRIEPGRALGDDRFELAQRHRLVGRVVDCRHGSTVVHLPHGTEEQQHGAVGRVGNGADHVERIDRIANERR